MFIFLCGIVPMLLCKHTVKTQMVTIYIRDPRVHIYNNMTFVIYNPETCILYIHKLLPNKELSLLHFVLLWHLDYSKIIGAETLAWGIDLIYSSVAFSIN